VAEGVRPDVAERLNAVLDPCSVAAGRPMGLVDMGLVERVEVRDDAVEVYLRLTSPACYLVPHLRDRIESELADLAARSVVVHVDEGLDWSPRLIAPHLGRPVVP
jgi:Predicted metal-sulfur cluster biosynthetic enzyme